MQTTVDDSLGIISGLGQEVGLVTARDTFSRHKKVNSCQYALNGRLGDS